MPTENRSSNTDMVSVPRELLERLDLGKNTATALSALPELRAILNEPVQQHQGEPVAWMDPRSPDMHATISNEVKQHNTGFGGAPGSAVSGYSIPLYTHSDTAEVERLREGMKYESERAALCLEELQECESQRDEFYAEITGLRAQLAEAQALLRRSAAFTHDLLNPISLRRDIHTFQSASAEPSAPTETSQLLQELDDLYVSGDAPSADVEDDHDRYLDENATTALFLLLNLDRIRAALAIKQ